jgi:hypothetical protein
MGNPFTLNNVRAACTPNALRKIRGKQLRSEIDILNLQRQSLPKLTDQEVTTRSSDIAPKYQAQYQEAELRVRRLKDRDYTCGDLNYHKSKSEELKTTVQSRDRLKKQLDDLRSKSPKLSERTQKQQQNIDSLRDQWIKAQVLASRKAKELAKVEGETIERFRKNSSDALFLESLKKQSKDSLQIGP